MSHFNVLLTLTPDQQMAMYRTNNISDLQPGKRFVQKRNLDVIFMFLSWVTIIRNMFLTDLYFHFEYLSTFYHNISLK